MGDSNQPQQLNWVEQATQVNAPRIPDEKWESVKDIILDEYLNKKKTLEQVINYMKEQHNFKATSVPVSSFSSFNPHQADVPHSKRQYIHRIGQKWGVGKYNKAGAAAVDDGVESGQGRRPRKKATPRSSQTPQATEPSSTPVSAPAPATAPVIRSRPSEQPQPRSTNPRVSDPQPPSRQVQPPQQSTFKSFTPRAHIHNTEQPQNIERFLPDLDATNAELWYKPLADILHSLGDCLSAFQILVALYSRQPELSLAILCARTAHTRDQVAHVQYIIESAINMPPVSGEVPEEKSWTKFLLGAQSAHYWGQTSNETNRSEQFGQLVEDYIDIWESEIRQPFTPRSPTLKLDITVYRYLYRALLYFDADPNNFTMEEPGLDIDKILGQFLGQQPAGPSLGRSNPLSEISCVYGCLRWCIGMLRHDHRPEILNTTGRSEYSIACMLWCVWMQNQGTVAANWSNDTMAQLDMSPSELLVTVVCMIMATEPDHGHTRSGPAPGIIRDALSRANTLAETSPRELLDRFLHQIRETSEQRMATSPPYLDLSEFIPFRNIISSCGVPVFIHLPRIPDGPVIHPLTLADPERAKDAVSSTLHPASGYAGLHSQPVDPELSLYQFG